MFCFFVVVCSPPPGHAHLVSSRPFLELETAEGRQVLGLLAGHAPVVGLVDGLVVLPGRLVVDGQPLDGLGGQRLNHKTVTSQKGQRPGNHLHVPRFF